MKTLLHADEDLPFCETLAEALSRGPSAPLIERAGCVPSAVERLSVGRTRIDLCLVDANLRDRNGQGMIDIVRRRFPHVRFAALTRQATPSMSERFRTAGAVACLPKRGDAATLARTIRSLLADEAPDEADRGAEPVSRRRLEIMRLAADGLLDKQIGAALGVCESTVRDHWRCIFDGLGASNRTHAVSKALRQGLI